MPKQNHNWHQRYLLEIHHSNLGDRVADKIADFMGSWKFIILQTIVVILWMLLNITAFVYQWDVYPFVLLNLVFSTQSAYAAPIIMMSQNREALRDRMQAESDFEVSKHAFDTININTELTTEIHRLTQEIHTLTKEVNLLIKAHKNS